MERAYIQCHVSPLIETCIITEISIPKIIHGNPLDEMLHFHDQKLIIIILMSTDFDSSIHTSTLSN